AINQESAQPHFSVFDYLKLRPTPYPTPTPVVTPAPTLFPTPTHIPTPTPTLKPSSQPHISSNIIPTPIPTPVTLTSSPDESSYYLDPSMGIMNKGCDFKVNVVVNTGGYTILAGDVVLKYDQTKLSVSNITAYG